MMMSSNTVSDNSNLIIKLIPKIQSNFEKSYKINRNSDENNLYMKNDQKNMMNPNMPSTYLSHTSNIVNIDFFALGSSDQIKPGAGNIFPNIFPLLLKCLVIH